MKLITFNIRCANDVDGNSIDERAPRLKLILDKYDADVIGFQEVVPEWYDHIQKDYSEKYEIFNKYRSLINPEGLTVLWKKDKLSCIDSGVFWFSDTPWAESKGNDSLCGCKRICQWVLLEDISRGKRFYFFNVHFGFSPDYQAESVHLIKKTAELLNAKNIIVSGDFNMKPESLAYAEMLKYFVDINSVTANYTGKTFHKYGAEGIDSHIDYGFADDGIVPSGYYLINDMINSKYPSDHYGIMFEFDIK